MRVFSGGSEQGLLPRCAAHVWHHSEFPCCRPQALGCIGFSSLASGLWSAGLIVVAYRLSYSLACGLLDQGSNPCLLHWQADSLPLSHRGCPSAQSLYLPSVHMLCSALTPTTVLCGTLLLLFFLLKLLHRQRSYILCRANSLAILFGLNFLHGTMWEAV